MSTILITGGAGFIGSNFVHYIFKKYSDYQLIILDSLTYAGNLSNLKAIRDDRRIEFWHGDVKNPEIVNELVSRSDYVVHFAAESHVSRSIYDNRIFFETDVIGTQVICNAVLRNKHIKKFIHISSSEVYGTALFDEPMTEEHPLRPLSPYASAKVGADRLVYSYFKTYEIPCIIIRPFNNYGAYQHLEKVIPRFITSAILDQPLKIHGDGTASRDWIYVKDHCEALDNALHIDNDALFGKAINIGYGLDIDLESIAKMILAKLNKVNSIIYIQDRPAQVRKHLANIDLAKKLLNWQPKTKFFDGLNMTIEWYLDNRNWWEPLRWMAEIPVKLKDGTMVMH